MRVGWHKIVRIACEHGTFEAKLVAAGVVHAIGQNRNAQHCCFLVECGLLEWILGCVHAAK
jgi:hypothetical protein